MATVNLDALIQRDDFEVSETSQGGGAQTQTLNIGDVKETAFLFPALRKPDFQRETNEWDPSRICEFLKSFLAGDLIPAVILWQHGNSCTFVIDGSHRISALAAWVNDDYGDGEISKRFYDGIIPDEQIEIAQRTRNLVRRDIGSFKDHELAASRPDKVKAGIADRAKRLGTLAIHVQWVRGDSSKAEDSFFKINEQGVRLNDTERRVLKARKKPNAIAARAIIRSGRGHKYWSAFDESTRTEIESIASTINRLLFQPPYDSPVKTLDLPVAGRSYAVYGLPLVMDFVDIVNNVPSASSHRIKWLWDIYSGGMPA